MIEVGTLCVKTAGRDAGLKCVVVEVVDDNTVVIDGQTRRRKCSIKHIEPLAQKLDIKSKATHSAVVAEFKKLDIVIEDKKPKKKQKSEKPKKLRKAKAVKPAAPEKKGK